jgi:methyl coenzyme M reductase gamma subunit
VGLMEDGYDRRLHKELEGRIKEVNDQIKEALDRNMDIDRFVGVREQLLDLRNNVGKALERLNSVLVGDFSDAAEFDDNVKKLIKAMVGGE